MVPTTLSTITASPLSPIAEKLTISNIRRKKHNEGHYNNLSNSGSGMLHSCTTASLPPPSSTFGISRNTIFAGLDSRGGAVGKFHGLLYASFLDVFSR